jgi:mRNA interferase RelE/StbE
MAYAVEVAPAAAKALKRLDVRLQARIRAKVRALAADPYGPNQQAKRLTGPMKDLFRLRVGDWRVLYRVEEDRTAVYVIDIGPRGGIYD